MILERPGDLVSVRLDAPARGEGRSQVGSATTSGAQQFSLAAAESDGPTLSSASTWTKETQNTIFNMGSPPGTARGGGGHARKANRMARGASIQALVLALAICPWPRSAIADSGVKGFKATYRDKPASKIDRQHIEALQPQNAGCSNPSAVSLTGPLLKDMPTKVTAVASLRAGVAVFGANGQLIARTGGYLSCYGPKARIVSLMAGQFVEDPDLELALVVEAGGVPNNPNDAWKSLIVLKRRGSALVQIMQATLEHGGFPKPSNIELKPDGSIHIAECNDTTAKTLYWDSMSQSLAPTKPRIPRENFSRLAIAPDSLNGLELKVQEGALAVRECDIEAIRLPEGEALCRGTESKVVALPLLLDGVNLKLKGDGLNCDPLFDYPGKTYRTKADCEWAPIDKETILLFQRDKGVVRIKVSIYPRPSFDDAAIELARVGKLRPDLDNNDFREQSRGNPPDQRQVPLASLPNGRIAIGQEDGGAIFATSSGARPLETSLGTVKTPEHMHYRGASGNGQLLALSFSTHDEEEGCPTNGGVVKIYRPQGATLVPVKDIVLNDGRQRFPRGMLTPDGRFLILKSGCNVWKCDCETDWSPFDLYEVETGRLVRTYTAQRKRVERLPHDQEVWHGFGRYVVDAAVTQNRFLFADREGYLLALGHDLGSPWLSQISTGGLQAFAASSTGDKIAFVAKNSNYVELAHVSDAPFRLSAPIRLAGHVAPVVAVAFSPDGRYLVSTGRDRRIRVWDAEGPRGLIWSSDGYSMDPGDVVWDSHGIYYSLSVLRKIQVGPFVPSRSVVRSPWLNWTNTPPTAAPRAEARIEWSDTDSKFRLSVSNTGHGNLSQLAGLLVNGRGRPIAGAQFGAVPTGKSVAVTLDPLGLAAPLDPKGERLTVFLADASGASFPPASLILSGAQVPAFRMVLRSSIADDGSGKSSGNSNGRADPGEAIDLVVGVKNAGKVACNNATLAVAMAEGPKCEGWRFFGDQTRPVTLAPGDENTQRFNLAVPGNGPSNCSLTVRLLAAGGKMVLAEEQVDVPLGR